MCVYIYIYIYTVGHPSNREIQGGAECNPAERNRARHYRYPSSSSGKAFRNSAGEGRTLTCWNKSTLGEGVGRKVNTGGGSGTRAADPPPPA